MIENLEQLQMATAKGPQPGPPQRPLAPDMDDYTSVQETYILGRHSFALFVTVPLWPFSGVHHVFSD